MRRSRSNVLRSARGSAYAAGQQRSLPPHTRKVPVRTPRRQCFDVVEGSGRTYVQPTVAESGRRLSSATMTRYWSSSSAGKGMFRERLVGHAADAGLMLRPANPESRVVQWNDTARCRRGGDADGRCEPQPRGGGAVHRGWRALVWCRSGLPAGISGWSGFAVGGLAGGGCCHTFVTSGAKHGGTQGDTVRRFRQVGGRGGTRWDS